MRIGFLLGFSPEILVKAAEIIALEKNQKTLRKAISDGVFGSATASESELRARLAQERKTRDRVEYSLKGFRVDEQYAVHQVRADELSRAIRELNDEGLSLEKRRSDLEAAMSEERPAIVGENYLSNWKRCMQRLALSFPMLHFDALWRLLTFMRPSCVIGGFISRMNLQQLINVLKRLA